MSLTLSVCISVHLCVCDKLQIDSSFLFLDGIEPFFVRYFFMTLSTKHCSSIFDLGPQRPKFAPQNLHKITYKSACMADRPDIFARNGVFGDGRFNGTIENVVEPTLVAMAMTFGLGAEI